MTEVQLNIGESLEKIRLKLLDLSKRNRLLNFRRSKQSIFIVDELPNQVFDRLYTKKAEMVFKPLPEPEEDENLNLEQDGEISKREFTRIRDAERIRLASEQSGIRTSLDLPQASSEEGEGEKKHSDRYLQTAIFQKPLETRLRRIASNARSVVEETGQNQLYMAFGFLEWKDSSDSGQTYLAPLIMMPVELHRGRLLNKTNTYDFSVSYGDADLFHNLTLAEKLKKDFGILLPTFDDDAVFNGAGDEAVLDPERYFSLVQERISGQKGWTVRRQIVLGFFAFSKLLMYLDLDAKSWGDGKALLNHELINDLLLGRERSDSPVPSEERDHEEFMDQIMTVVDADSSQFTALHEAMSGRSMVIEGPPGTGKSQTITNLVASFLSEGKSILFVAEKMAALNVVRRNLDKIGLGDFCLELHSHKARKKRVLEDIKKRWRKTYRDTEKLDQELTRLKDCRAGLREYVDAVNSVAGPFGETIFDIFWRIEALRTKVPENIEDLKIENPTSLKSVDIDARTSLLKEIARHIEELGVPIQHPLHGLYLDELYFGKEAAFKAGLERARDAVDQLIRGLNQEFHTYGIDLKAEAFSIEEFSAVSRISEFKVPLKVEESLFQTFVGVEDNSPWKQLEELNSCIDRYQKERASASKVFRDSASIGEQTLEELLGCCLNLLESISENIDLDGLARINESVSILSAHLEHIASLTHAFVINGLSRPESIEDFCALEPLASLLAEQPQVAGLEYSRELFSTRGNELFERVLEEGKKLGDERKKLGEIFSLSDIPPREELARVKRILRVHSGKFFAFLSSEYRQAKNLLFEFLKNSKQVKEEGFIDKLEQLESHLEDQTAFRSNEEFKTFLGDAFNGIGSNWDGLRKTFAWIQAANRSVGDERIAHHLSDSMDQGKEEALNLDAVLESISVVTREVEFIQSKLLPFSPEEREAGLSKMRIQPLRLRLGDLHELISKILGEAKSLVHSDFILLRDLKGACAAQLDAIGLKREVEEPGKYAKFLGSAFNGIESNLEDVNKTAKWLENLNDAGIPAGFLKAVFLGDYRTLTSRIAVGMERFSEILGNWERGYRELSSFGGIQEKKAFGGPTGLASFDRLKEKLSSIENALDQALRWAEFSRSLKSAGELGLSEIVEKAETGELCPENLVPRYELTLYQGIAEAAVAQNPILSRFSRAQHEEKRKKFIELDKGILVLARERIGYRASRRPVPKGVSRGPVSRWSESGLLDREVSKSKRHIPIRKLLNRAGRAIRALKPCFMMSPMSVAQYLEPGDHEFDVIIMDEASQVKPHEAFGAVARGKQIIIVGDPKQLPPTNFFDSMVTNQDGDEADENIATVDDTESILDLCKTAHFPSKRLKWHYRSEHESLIAFSNSHWYDNELIIFPSTDTTQTELGVKFHYLPDARYSASKNEREAEFVAQAIVDHAKRSPELSLGVGTFNIQQKTLIEDILEKLRKAEPSNDTALEKILTTGNGNEPLFIKNLENLQGDERDVIFVCCTYGPDKETGRVLKRFGPINGKYGPNRLNVMFTRAKKRMEVFSSMKAEDIVAGPGDNPGTIALKRFLHYAETGILVDEGRRTGAEPDSDFEVAVAKALDQHGYHVEGQVGVSGYRIDIGVYHPDREGEFILGVECDGATYHSAKYARDRDRLREEVLNRRGWTIHRVWSTDWFKNRSVEIDRLLNKLNSMRERDQHRVRRVPPPEVSIPTERTEESRISPKDLRAQLLRYRVGNMPARPESARDGILRNELLDLFVEMRPINIVEFRERIPLKHRENICHEERQYLDDVLELIEEAVE